MSYDVQLCRADVTTLLGTLDGTYTVGGFDALVNNQSTSNASFSVVIVFADAFLPPRRVALYDGLQTLSVDVVAQQTVTLDGIDVDDPPTGDLTWYALEGDVGGSAGEQVEASGFPGGGSLVLADAINPADNPMNHTINTTVPAQPDTIGVDIDAFALDAALAVTDTALDVTYSAGMDKFWIAYNVVGVDVFEPVLGFGSGKDVVLFDDVGGDGEASPGDTVRYTIHLQNSGNADAVVDLDDPIPPEAASWTLVDAGGGTDQSLADTLVVVDIALAIDASTDVVFDVVIADVPDGTVMSNTAAYAVEPGGAADSLTAPDVVIANAGGTGSSSGESTGAGSSSGDGVGTGLDGSGSGEGGSERGDGSSTDGGGSGSTGTGMTDGSSGSSGETSAATSSEGGAEGAGAGDGCGCAAPAGVPFWAWPSALCRRRRRRR
jgi:hypothetical protein